MSFLKSIFSSNNDLKEMLHKEAAKYGRKQFKYEQTLNNNRRLAKYVRRAFKIAVQTAYKKSNSDHIYVWDHEIGINEFAFDAFYMIFLELCKELNISIKRTSSNTCGIYFNTASLKQFVESHKPQFDVDERVKAMLTTGIYR